MEFVEGKSVDEIVPANSTASPEFTLRLIKDCASRLDHAHSRGIFHHDVKPGNIMLDDAAGSAKIADFGIAKLLTSSTDLTGGYAVGTLYYMSPEQMEARSVDGRSDQYSLAVVAYRLLTSRLTFDADTIATWCRSLATEPPVPASTRNPGDRRYCQLQGRLTEGHWLAQCGGLAGPAARESTGRVTAIGIFIVNRLIGQISWLCATKRFC